MTALILHGLVPADTEPPEGAPPHERIPAGRLVGLATACPHRGPGDAPDAAMSAILAHNALLAAFAAAGDVLPVRYGTAFSSRAALAAHLAEHEGDYVSAVAPIAGAREWGVRASLRAPGQAAEESPSARAEADGASGGFAGQERREAPRAGDPGGIRDRSGAAARRASSPDDGGACTARRDSRAADTAAGLDAGAVPIADGSGRAFLAQRRDRRLRRASVVAARARWASDLAERLGDLGRGVLPRPPKPDRLVDLAILVPVAAEEALHAALAEAAASAAPLGLRLSLSGPWPAYSFCDATSGDMATPGRGGEVAGADRSEPEDVHV